MNRIPVLMYHGLSEHVGAETPSVHVSVMAFREQMRWLSEFNYETITVDTLLEAWLNNQPLKKKVIITFDDGYFSILKYALPILKDYGFVSTFFLTTSPIDSLNYSAAPRILDSVLPQDRPLSWEECNKLIQDGWEPGGHSLTHPDHRFISKDDLENQIGICKEQIERKTGYKVKHYAYPFGGYNAEVILILRKLGYLSAFSVHSGLSRKENGNYQIHRICIEKHTSLSVFIKMVETGYSSISEFARSTLRDLVYKNMEFKDLIEKMKSLPF